MSADAPLSMTLGNLLQGYAEWSYGGEAFVKGLSLDSRKCCSGSVYFAVPGLQTHGLNYVEQAIENGAIAVVVDNLDPMLQPSLKTQIEASVPCVTINALASVMGEIAARFYKTNEGDCKIVGVTGTDGKTSVTYFIARLLNQRENTAAILGTTGWGFPDHLTVSELTTPDVFSVHEKISALKSLGARYVCMEVSSHALDQGRVNGIAFHTAVFTNLARDHLDYHKTIDNYAAAKRKLFEFESLCAVVLNIDDAFGSQLLQSLTGVRCISYGAAGTAEYRLSDLQYSPQGLDLLATVPAGSFSLKTQLIGAFNAHNLLAAWAVVECLGVKIADPEGAMHKLQAVVGRMECFKEENKPTIVVDYAHTPQALESAINSVATHCDGKVWCVFGCGGDRDKGKRAEMGRVAANHADYVIVTNDNPRSETPERIVEDIKAGIPDAAVSFTILDRTSAIRHAILHAATNDWVLVAGKGHEDYQLFAGERTQYSDRDTVVALLQEAV